MVKAQKFICTSIFDGEPKLSDFDLQTEVLPALNESGNIDLVFCVYWIHWLIPFEMWLDVLVETVYWSVDPYMRVQMPQLPVNSTMIGENIARLV